MEGHSAVLDLLFDKSEGILKDDLPTGLETIDFSTFDLMTESFDDFLFDGALVSDEKKTGPQISAYTDHDYVLQPAQSPASSDSGVSIESDSSSPRVGLDTNTMAGSPNSVSQFSPQPLGQNSNINSPSSSDILSHSPNNGLENLEFENFDFSEITNMNFDTLDTNALAESSPRDCDMLDEDVSIDLGNHSDLMTFDTTTNVTQNADGSETKTIKIIKVSATDTLPFTMKDVSTDTVRSGSFPELKLTEEEKDLLSREGLSLPTNMPLTKEEERQLKAIRRKIRNKISAKESRKRKMDYVEGLEKRVKLCTQENHNLHKKVDSLEKKNVTLITQLKRLQSLINLRSTKTAQASTCVMVLLLSFAFLVVPNFNPMNGDNDLDDIKSIPLPGNSRNLLNKGSDDFAPAETDNPYGITMRPSPFWEYPPQTPAVEEVEKMGSSKSVGSPNPEDPSKFTDTMDTRDYSDNSVDIGEDFMGGDVKKKTENVIFVQIEKEIPADSNITYVYSEAEYKNLDQTGQASQKTEQGREKQLDTNKQDL